jgi:hypothetical protein
MLLLFVVTTVLSLGNVAQSRPAMSAMALSSRRILLEQISTTLVTVASNAEPSSSSTVAAQYGAQVVRGEQPTPGGGVMMPAGLSGVKLQPDMDGQWNPPTMTTTLGKTRIGALELSPLQQLPFTDQELYYPRFLFGSWQVRATLKRKIYPYGKSFVPSSSLLEGSPRNRQEQVGSTTTYEAHYYSTLANTIENQLTVQLGLGIPKSKIIADRSFNAISLSKAYTQLSPIEQVEWNPSKDPTHLSLTYAAQSVAEDMRPLGPRRGEVYITARQSEFPSDSCFAGAEHSRSVLLLSRNAIVSDTESVTEFHQVGPNEVRATNRIAVYLTPNPNSREGVMWQQVGGKAIALFDYEIEMERILQSFVVDGGREEVQRACVGTPKDVVQCE